MSFLGFNAPVEHIGFIGNSNALAEVISKSTGKPTGGAFPLGNITSALIDISTEKVSMKDMGSGSMGTLLEHTVSTTMSVTLTLGSLSPENIALGAYSDVIKDAAEVGKTFVGSAYRDRSIIPDGIIASVESITGADAVELVEGTDYIVSNGSIYFTPESAITDGEEVQVSYTTVNTKRLEAMINSDLNLRIVFDGMNVSRGNAPVKVTLHNVAISPMTQRQLIGSDYGSIELKGTLLLSRQAFGPGYSRYFKEEHADAI
ncbi:hypothetical protein [Stutzerimonas kunmingensis]|uniref:Uncharacterized protein n=1 Tax=Stutzerimonas kunmingensis TaxID=1211807 RepID=A0A9X1N5I0_9GAMM|nr:hypothetical protein [Stutzerimonas kunmingensis]MCD1608629.1 hypothetical protein [Stutzerimonas kunmingensis]